MFPVETTAEDPVTNIYLQEESFAEMQFSNVQRYLYGLEVSQEDNMGTIDQMNETVAQLFFIIKGQL